MIPRREATLPRALRTILAIVVLSLLLGVNDYLDLPSLLIRWASAVVNLILAQTVLDSLLAGDISSDPVGLAAAVSVLLLVWIALAVAIKRYNGRVRRAFNAATPGRRVGVAAWIVVAALVLSNPFRGGGFLLPIVLLALGATTIGLILLATRFPNTRSFVAIGFWVGLILLPLVGTSILFSDGPALLQRQLVHTRIGFVWIPFLLAASILHVSSSPVAKRRGGYTSGLIVGISVLVVAGSGLVQGLFGRLALFGNTYVHVGFSMLLFVALGRHLLLYWKTEAATANSGRTSLVLSRLDRVSALVVACLVLQPLLSNSPTAGLRDSSSKAVGHLETPLDSTWTGTTRILQAEVLSELENPLGCGRSAGCHLDIQVQWSKSAHRFAANRAYRGTVEILVAERGVEAARFCARCHDPAPLYSGRIRAGLPYPLADSEGVTCVSCHALVPEDTHLGNGRYDLHVPLQAIQRTGNEISAYMTVRNRPDLHRSDWLPPSLEIHTACAACHTLSLGDVHLRRTFDEWTHARDAQRLPEADSSCTTCHMPLTGGSILGSFDIHDHEFSGGNIALATLRGRTMSDMADAIAAAIDITASIHPIQANHHELSVNIVNSGSGHDFPIGPRDLMRYWFEWRMSRPQSDWRPLGNGNLFEEILYDAAGTALRNHEVWRAEHETSAARIPPGGTRSFRFRIDIEPADASDLELRLMHRRFTSEFVANVIGPDHDLDTGTAEIHLVKVRQ